MFRLKACPKCRGDLRLDYHRWVGDFWTCCQCGRNFDPDSAPRRALAEERTPLRHRLTEGRPPVHYVPIS